MPISPDTGNYYVGKGAVYFTPVGGVERHIGNVPEFELEIEIEELEHFSSMEGTRSKDLTVAAQKSATLRILMDEWSYQNLSFALLGDTDNDSDGNITIDIMSENLIRGAIRFAGANDVGPQWNMNLPSVAFKPSAAIGLITDEWGQLEVTGTVEIVDGSFGTMTLQDSATTETATTTETGTTGA